MRLVVTRPQHDFTTLYLSAWAEEIIRLAKEKGIDVIDLFLDKANRKELEGRINKLSPGLIFLNGHGNDNFISGHDNEIIIKAEENHELLKGKTTYALSCNSAKILGKKVAEYTDSTYIGYNDEFIFMIDGNYLTKPLEDPKAKPFMEASNQVMISILKGHSAPESSRRSKDKFKEHFNKLLASNNADPDSLQSAQFLWWNMRNQVCMGNGYARLPKG